MSTEQEVPWRRVLDASKGSGYCSSTHVKYPLVSQSGMHQLHIFIFMLAVLHFLQYFNCRPSKNKGSIGGWRCGFTVFAGSTPGG